MNFDGFDKVTVKSIVLVAPLAPSVTATGESIEIVGGSSSSVIVPVPDPSEIDAYVAPESCNVYASLAPSSLSSPSTVTSTVLVVSPTAKVSVVVPTAV